MLLFVSGYSILGYVDHKALILAPIFSFVTMYWRFYHEAMFYEVDRRTGKKTFAVVCGPKMAVYLRRVFLLLGVGECVVLFLLSWFSLEFSLLLGLYWLFSMGFWHWFDIFKPLRSVMGEMWGIIFLPVSITLLIL